MIFTTNVQNPLKHKNDFFNNTIDSFKIFKKIEKYPKTV